MKHLLLLSLTCLFAATLVSAQEKPRFNPDLTWSTLRAAYAIRIPMTSDLAPEGGATVSIPLWRFSLDITPAFHYLLTNNFSESHRQIDPANGALIGSPALKPLRWQFSIDFGVSYLF